MLEDSRKIGYARVSTDEQHLDMQLVALTNFGCDLICQDKGLSGARFDRPGLQEALTALQDGDALVVWKLDRLGRSLSDLAAIIARLDKRMIRVVSLTEYIDTRSSSGRFTFHMLAAMAEFERSLISERTRAGMAAAKERGSHIGRPKVLNDSQRTEALNLLKTQSATQVAKRFNIHRSTLRRHVMTHRLSERYSSTEASEAAPKSDDIDAFVAHIQS